MVSPTTPSGLSSRVATTVAEKLVAQGITQREIAHSTGIPRETLRRRLTGHSAFTVDELERIAAVLDLDPAVLFIEPDTAQAVAS